VREVPGEFVNLSEEPNPLDRALAAFASTHTLVIVAPAPLLAGLAARLDRVLDSTAITVQHRRQGRLGRRARSNAGRY
jgi:hypothetical protein